jgi:catechol 2,3-dioxygenase-like lactoylglutathione lyase family enzyme
MHPDLPHPAIPGAVLDHVAVAVADLPAASAWWRGIGATPVTSASLDGFSTEQLRLSNGGKVELIGRGADGRETFIDAYLSRYGSGRIHHLTLKVPDALEPAVERLDAAGLQTVDVRTDDAHWHEAFLRPRQVGRVIVQVAWASGTDADFAARMGLPAPLPPDPAAPALAKVVLGHPDVVEAGRTWALLGAELTPTADGFTATWDHSPITVEVRTAATAGPMGLVLHGHPAADGSEVAPAILPA